MKNTMPDHKEPPKGQPRVMWDGAGNTWEWDSRVGAYQRIIPHKAKPKMKHATKLDLEADKARRGE